MVFHAPSPRTCPLAEAERIGAALHRRGELAGVFVNASLGEIADVSDRVGLTLIQLQGDEGPAFCGEVARRTGARTIKAAALSNAGVLQELERFHTDFVLVDGHTPGLRGGGGTRADLKLLRGWRSSNPLILGGGLNPDNVADAIDAVQPYAVDVASGVESSPGIKSHEAMQAFFEAAMGEVLA
jgi:phosphoribosylanthranilate isomerase